jgi:hypothetical protein
VVSKDFNQENLRKERLRRSEGGGGAPSAYDRSIYYKDVALIRYKDEATKKDDLL